MNKFVSDFSLFPIKKLSRPGWEYRKATWPDISIDEEVHKLMDGKRTIDVTYNRKVWKGKHKGTIQTCTITTDPVHGYVVNPGDGWDFIIRRDSYNNYFDDSDSGSDNDDSDTDNDLTCVICLTNKKNHIVPNCGHVVACGKCAKKIKDKCPICRSPFTGDLKKIYF